MDVSSRSDRLWNRLKVFGGLVVLAFAVTLAIVVGNRLSDESLAVLAGAVCGVGAAIPTSLLIVWVSRRQETRSPAYPAYPQGAYPPVVVVAPPGGQQHIPGWNAAPPPGWNTSGERQFTVVGGATYEHVSPASPTVTPSPNRRG